MLRLPVRFHLLSSDASAALSTTRTEREVSELLELTNSIWKQANIEWYAESVVREDSERGAFLDSLLAGRVPRTGENLIVFVPRDKLLEPGWNVFLIRDFGRIAGGMFHPDIVGVVLAERGFGFDLPATSRGGATLAHELGHSLGLSHQPCDSTRNIMANACWSSTASSSLSAAQIEEARRQASTGRPAARIPSP